MLYLTIMTKNLVALLIGGLLAVVTAYWTWEVIQRPKKERSGLDNVAMTLLVVAFGAHCLRAFTEIILQIIK